MSHLTPADIAADPEYYISGPGQDEASRTDCAHGYSLLSSCPGCDAET